MGLVRELSPRGLPGLGYVVFRVIGGKDAHPEEKDLIGAFARRGRLQIPYHELQECAANTRPCFVLHHLEALQAVGLWTELQCRHIQELSDYPRTGLESYPGRYCEHGNSTTNPLFEGAYATTDSEPKHDLQSDETSSSGSDDHEMDVPLGLSEPESYSKPAAKPRGVSTASKARNAGIYWELPQGRRGSRRPEKTLSAIVERGPDALEGRKLEDPTA